MTDNSQTPVHHLLGTASDVHCGDNRLGCGNGCEESMIFWSVAVSGIVCEENARADHSCQLRTTWSRQLGSCDVREGGKVNGDKMGNARVR